MPTLLLLQKGDPATMNALERASLVQKCTVHRHPHIPPPQTFFNQPDVALYGGSMFALSQAKMLNMALLAPTPDWHARLPTEFLRREITAGGEMPSPAPVTFAVQFRCFVVEGRVIAMSPSHRNGKPCLENGTWVASPQEKREALSFAVRVLLDERIMQPPSFVLDVGLLEERGWAVVQANSCYNAWLYGCDPEQMLSALRRACRHRSLLTKDDLPWVVR